MNSFQSKCVPSIQQSVYNIYMTFLCTKLVLKEQYFNAMEKMIVPNLQNSKNFLKNWTGNSKMIANQ